VKVVPFLDRSTLLELTTHTVLHNLGEGIILVVVILFLFLGNVRGALIVAVTIPFSLLFAAICLDLRHIPANLLSLGALDFGMVEAGAVVMVENIVLHLGRQGNHRTAMEQIRESAHEVQRPVFYAIGIIITSSRCRAWRGACSNRWPGRSRSRCSARWCFRFCWRRRCAASCFAARRASGTTRS
jgi:cobalt-zinc-cadmium resistance protein CzcA